MAVESSSSDLVNVVALLGAAVVMVPLFQRLYRWNLTNNIEVLQR